ncbi:MbtH family protein [Streptomyces sp. ICBB 8177]|uniref:MbtH family protein n=1 Tax=Streptomyces sp. ICBB 8177 TaxID=563922 RepID=UPI000D67D51A|nr:MbtH family protein [Streptomyces sp. ICBB 8177]PWI45359.1 MbtH family protein [Streptomyces sp. ICBB 8177]
MTNPFANPSGFYLVLANAEQEHCLWPAFAAVPAGWTVKLQASSRQQCLDYVEAHWAAMRAPQNGPLAA